MTGNFPGKFFAAVNSAGGFVSWFDEIFKTDELGRLFIIKGGSGTGKSTLMKRIADRGVSLGCECEYYYCSSDPKSLDGIILRDNSARADARGVMNYKSIAIIDGTAPHTRDPKLPGAADEIVNLGDYWQTDALCDHRGELARLTNEKTARFNQSYEFLYAAGELDKLLNSDAARFILTEKLNAAAERLIEQAKKGLKRGQRTGAFRLAARPVSALSTLGRASFDTYRESAGKVCEVTDVMGTSQFMFDALINLARRQRLEVYRAPVPLEPSQSEALYFPRLDLAVVRSDKPGDYYNPDLKIINMERFIDRSLLTQSDRKRRRMLTKYRDELISDALAGMSEAGELHGEIERIYREAMDFDAVGRFCDELEARIFS